MKTKAKNRQSAWTGQVARSEAIVSAGLSRPHGRELAPDRPYRWLTTSAKNERRLPPRSIVRRCFDLMAWIVPGVTLILLPKCPACLAAYVALVGVGISMTTSVHLQTTLIIGCVGALLFLTIKYLRARACCRIPAGQSR